MQKVVNISLNGIAYQLEEPGYNQLRSYLERAESRLKDSPDRAEVMDDLEQAIGEKCARVLGPHKTVVNEAEVAKIIEEMGPVESAEEKGRRRRAPKAPPEHGAQPYSGPQPRKRLFNIREGAMWAGVCNGIAAYINVDVTWVRIAFVLITIFSWGGMILVYIALAFIVPTADTAEDRAAAFGMPFNTEELIGRAKKNFEKFGSDYRWRREWRRQQRHWNRQWHQMSEQVRKATAQAAPQMSHTARAITGVFLPIAAIVGAVLFVALDPRAVLADHPAQRVRLGAAARHAAVGGHPRAGAAVLRDFRAAQDGSSRRPAGRGLSSGLGRAARPHVDRIHRAVLLGRVYLLPGSS